MLCRKNDRSKPLFVLFLLLPMLVCSLAGCTPQQASAPQTDVQQTEVQQSDNKYSFTVQDGLVQQMSSTIAEKQALPTLTAAPLPIKDIYGLYSRITQLPLLQDEQHDKYYYPQGQGFSEILYCGEEPFYDVWLNLETVRADTRIYFETCDYSNISAVFAPHEDAAEVGTEPLHFSDADAAKALVNQISETYGFETTFDSCASLTADTLQKLYNSRSENGTLRNVRYRIESAGGLPNEKNTSAVADWPLWTQEDECYYIEGATSFYGIPIAGGSLEAYVNSNGIIQYNATGILAIESQTTPAPLQSRDAILNALDTVASTIYSEDGITLSDAQLFYHLTEMDTYQPLWRFTLQYTFTNPAQEKEDRTATVWIDACTAEEFTEKEVY